MKKTVTTKKQAAKKAREYSLKKKYGITIREYNKMLKEQNSVCCICGNTPKTRKLAVDHNHRTGKVRGLLCHRCNRGIGLFVVDRTDELIIAAAAYVRRSFLEAI